MLPRPQVRSQLVLSARHPDVLPIPVTSPFLPQRASGTKEPPPLPGASLDSAGKEFRIREVLGFSTLLADFFLSFFYFICSEFCHTLE